MATIRKRGNSYQIRVSCVYDTNGNHKEQSMTWKPEKGMTERQIQKELNRVAVNFEEACSHGYKAAVKFQDFAEQWFKEYAEIALKAQTVRCYRSLETKVYKAIGHLHLDKINTRTIQKFVTQLTEEKKYNSKGEEIGKLAPKTIKHYIGFISTVMAHAVRMQMIQVNPCKNVTLPKIVTKERKVYTIDKVQQMLNLFENESEANFKYVIFFTLAAFTGLRRGELLELEWKDVDFENNVISIRRTSNYTAKKGVYTDTTKTKKSQRTLKFPQFIMDMLKEYKAEQDAETLRLGDRWVETDRLYVKWDGRPMQNGTPYFWLGEFCEKHDLPFYGLHSFRHLFCSLLVNQGVDIVTVSGAMGHSTVSTTVLISYGHTYLRLFVFSFCNISIAS